MFSSSSYDESTAPSTHTESIAALSAHGGRKFTTSNSRYVIHTHTIPLATTVDQQRFLNKDNSESYFHGYLAGEKGSVHCSARSCMYVRSDKTRAQERLKKNCPCYEVALENGGMQPLCFLVYVRSLNRNLTGTFNDEDPAQNINPSEIMFCQSATGIFDNSYPGKLRDATGVTGWGHVTDKSILSVMDYLYWFRKFQNQYKLNHKIREQLKLHGLRRVKHFVMQTLHTINSLIVKKLIAFSPEVEGYNSLAKHTAWAFATLFMEYCATTTITDGGLYVEPTTGFYVDTKAFSAIVKSSFHKEMRTDRLSAMSWRPSTKCFGAFFGSELRKLSAYVDTMYSSQGIDYTLSPAWIFRMTTLAQTRGIGYLPEAIAECKRQSFRMTVNRELVRVEPEITHLQAMAVKQRLTEGGIPPLILSEDRVRSRPKEEQEKFQEIFSRIEMPLKGSASVDTFVKDGGKIEDARLLLSVARANDWKIPVRDLNSHNIVEYITIEKDSEADLEHISRPLFWISYQLFLNHWALKGQWAMEDYYPLLDRGVEYAPGIMNTKIVHISEPGKERNLTKSHATLAWLLTPGAKLAQGTLAMLKEHRAGLLESGHEWRHQKRVSALSDESGFIYDSRTGKTYPDILHIFKDWTESTDFICKITGYTHLRTFFDFVGFPYKYGRLILKTIVEPQPVTEVTTHRTIPGEDSYEPVNWKGFIREGFMMGNPMTKPILHLVHESERAVATLFLRKRNLRSVPNYKFGMFTDQGRLDRSESSKDRTIYSTLEPRGPRFRAGNPI
ncbi:RNA-dependent RNA polymerase [Sclerotinia sclerotiorum narnavirus 5]|uniref:RNA-dependent RNA polymerase n=1 Tax=Sclerotinia sclerotiorum narnavirus 5 TaxID=2992275 RepID=A0A9E7VBY2_9VIRU|nr:RNA-dependent RNA polymerase [Sclerotinia sclerotiorum narnavirus 5]